MRRNCHFFSNAAAAENAGYRPCLRCRPELAPGHGVLDVSSRLAQAAALRIEEGFLNHASTQQLAARIGVGERHLRRIFVAEFGVSLPDYAQTQRLQQAVSAADLQVSPTSTMRLLRPRRACNSGPPSCASSATQGHFPVA